MKFIGGEDMSDAQRQALAEAELQRRRMRYALRPKRVLVAMITRQRKTMGVSDSALTQIIMDNGTCTDLANYLIGLEDIWARHTEQEFHATAQRNALGGYIGCDGPACWALIKQIEADNSGHKIQSTGRENRS